MLTLLAHGYLLSAAFKKVETTLPQDPKANTKARKKQLKAKQEDYMWTSEVSGPRSRCMRWTAVGLGDMMFAV